MGMKSRTAVFLSEDVQRIDWEQGQPEQGQRISEMQCI